VVDAILKAVIAVDLTSGANTVISSPTLPNANNRLSYSTGIELDAGQNYALITDIDLHSVIEMDLITGERVYFSR
jgi:hypothetical protein